MTPYEEAEYRVKVGHWTRQGSKVRGVVHVGANDGYEIQFYLALGAAKVLAFEPEPDAFMRMLRVYQDHRVEMLRCGLGDRDEIATLRITAGDGKGSTFLREVGTAPSSWPYGFIGDWRVLVRRFDSLGIDPAPYNVLVVDVQGMELQVLKGFGEMLQEFDFLNVECSAVPLYGGEASAAEVVQWLADKGFRQDSPVCPHDDVMFVREGALGI